MPNHKFIALGICLAGALNVLLFTGYANVQSLVGCFDSLDVPTNNLSQLIPNNSSNFDPEGIDCGELLRRFRLDEIDVAKREGGATFQRSFVTVAWTGVDGARVKKDGTSRPIYVATHDREIDSVRASIMTYRYYYETKLTELVAETFDRKRREGKESVFMDVGANIGLNGWYPGNFVVPVAKGVGNAEEEKELYAINGDNPGSFSFQPKIGAKVVGKMSITTLDSFAERHRWFHTRPSIGFFKLDVEHFEKEVLEGAQKLLKSGIVELIAMELRPDHSKENKARIVGILFELDMSSSCMAGTRVRVRSST